MHPTNARRDAESWANEEGEERSRSRRRMMAVG